MGVVALKLPGVVNKSGRVHTIFRVHFARGLFSTLLDEILDTPPSTLVSVLPSLFTLVLSIFLYL